MPPSGVSVELTLNARDRGLCSAPDQQPAKGGIPARPASATKTLNVGRHAESSRSDAGGSTRECVVAQSRAETAIDLITMRPMIRDMLLVGRQASPAGIRIGIEFEGRFTKPGARGKGPTALT